jgi:hypothetical protein
LKIDWTRSLGWNLDRATMERTDIITDGADCYPWKETFVIWPRRSITGAPLFWTKAYKRKVWVIWGSGFHMEPEVQYATAFDILSL